MKVVSSLLILFVGTLVTAHANVVLTDDFSYPDGNLVGAPNSPWQNHSGTVPVTVTNGAMRLHFNGSEDVNALLSGGPYTIDSQTILYSSFKVRFTALPSLSGGYFAHFKDTNSGPATGFGGRIFASTTNAASGRFRLSIGNGTLANPTNAQIATDLSLDTVYTVVTRFVPSTGVATMWLNPNVETDPSVTATDEGTATRPNPIDVVAYAFRQAGGIGTSWVDDLRVGTAFTDVAGPNNPPSISNIPNQSTPRGVAVGPIAFVIGDVETAAGSLTLSKMSTNTALVPDSNIVFGGSGSNRTVTITPAANVQGQTAITITVSDGTSQASVTFLVSVGFPTISAIPDQQTPVDTPTGQIPFTIGDAETTASSLVLTATSSDPSVAPEANIVFAGTGSNRTVRVTPATGASGLTTITITVSDGEVSAQESFVLTVHPVLGLLKSDNFNRPNGPLADGSFWGTHSGTFQETQITNNKARLSSSQTEDVSTDLPGAPFIPGGGHILYSSFTVNFEQLPTSAGGYFAHFKSDGNDFRGRVYANTAGAAPGRYRLGIANNAASIGPDGQFPADLSLGVTYVVVTRYNVGSGVSTLWVDPDSESSPSVTAPDTPSAANIWYYALRQSAGIGTLFLDNVHVAGQFVSVLIPRLAIAKAGGDIQISWPADVDYRLEATSSFSPENWGAVSETPSVIGNRKVVTLVAPAGDRFFRLIEQ